MSRVLVRTAEVSVMAPTLTNRHRLHGGMDGINQTDATCSASATLKHIEFIIRERIHY